MRLLEFSFNWKTSVFYRDLQDTSEGIYIEQ